MRNTIISAALAAACLVPSAQAQTVVNFDQSTDTATYVSQGLVLSGFTISDNTFGNAVLVPSTPNYANVNATGSSISFVDAATGIATTSNGFGLTIPGLNLGGGFYAGATLSFLGVSGDLLGTQMFAPVGPNESRAPLSYANNFQNIASVVFTRLENSNGPALFPIDNVTFTLNDVAAVPEPASWAMMIAGFGLVGGAMRRRSIRASVAV